MAALVNLINQNRPDHVLTVEDPIEYIHTSKRAVINQRQVVTQTATFASALRAALREDPDVIVIGELRDLETISLAITAAETGHLVMATLHTNNTIRTINRILDVFPPKQQPQIRAMVSESLRAIIRWATPGARPGNPVRQAGDLQSDPRSEDISDSLDSSNWPGRGNVPARRLPAGPGQVGDDHQGSGAPDL